MKPAKIIYLAAGIFALACAFGLFFLLNNMKGIFFSKSLFSGSSPFGVFIIFGVVLIAGVYFFNSAGKIFKETLRG